MGGCSVGLGGGGPGHATGTFEHNH
jgi:hypothetical protein